MSHSFSKDENSSRETDSSETASVVLGALELCECLVGVSVSGILGEIGNELRGVLDNVWVNLYDG